MPVPGNLRNITLVTAILVALLTPPALAHRVNVFAWVEGRKVHTESYFSGGKKCRGATIEVYDSQGNRLLEGKTNEKGEFSFVPPVKTGLTIVLKAGMGHRNDFFLSAAELGGATGESETQPESAPANQASAITRAASPDAEQLEAIIGRTLDKRLRPLVRMVEELRRERVTVSQVVGGIGYIFGLAGVLLYAKSRKTTGKPEGRR